jgi:hypothetical protein
MWSGPASAVVRLVMADTHVGARRGRSRGFYRKLGFQLTGEHSEGQPVGMLDLTNA